MPGMATWLQALWDGLDMSQEAAPGRLTYGSDGTADCAKDGGG